MIVEIRDIEKIINFFRVVKSQLLKILSENPSSCKVVAFPTYILDKKKNPLEP